MSLPTIAQHAKLHGIIPDKKLGQNFLFDLSLCEKIARSAGDISNKFVVEVGPGPAGLSRAILNFFPQKLIVIERDKRCLNLLQDVQSTSSNMEILNEDALKVQLSSLGHKKLTLISNLPYNIGTELVFRWLDQIEYVDSMTLMLQKEVVDRICAPVSTKDYGKLSIMCQLICSTQKQFDVSPQAFYPPPKVISTVVKLIPKSQQYTKEIIERVRKISTAAFMQRRKMIKSSLKNIQPDIESLIVSAGISPESRAENLTVEDYVNLAELCPFLK
ncbi:MAG: Dimethyladenosine transferase [Pseudomonadota bacterium]|jgi:16S rRNA (adenine1518-N6/adenine1519-N6)-dimethyltransferase